MLFESYLIPPLKFTFTFAVLNLAVDLRYRRYAFRGLAREPPRSFRTCGVSLSSCIPQESSAFRSNQQVLKSTVSINTAFN